MDNQSQSRAPLLLVILLLLVPVLYVGSYFALVVPYRRSVDGVRYVQYPAASASGNEFHVLAHKGFWPLAWIDMQVRPDEWCENY